MGLPWTKTTEPSKTTNSPVAYEEDNEYASQLKDAHDAFAAKHTTSGVHDDPILAKGWAKVTMPGGTPTLASNTGIVSAIADQAVGHTRLTLSTAASTTDDIDPQVTVHDTSGAWVVSVNVVDTTHVDVYTRDANTESLGDIAFSINVRIQ